MDHDLLTRRVLFIVGKGGGGKSTVAALLAVALAERGKRVLLAPVGPGGRRAEGAGGASGRGARGGSRDRGSRRGAPWPLLSHRRWRDRPQRISRARPAG